MHQDGLVHVSQLADRFVKDPAEVVKVQQRVRVTVLEVDLPRKRIALSMRSAPEAGRPREERRQPVPPTAPARPAAPRPPQPPARAGGFNNAFADALRKRG